MPGLFHASLMNLTEECKRVLLQNWREGYTVPSPNLYPFQWNWDSAFIALGYLHIDPEMAFQEMEHLFKGQWDNGFLPHIVFHNEEKYSSGYFPSADYWNSGVSDKAPKDLKTTGISQPPIHGYVLERMYDKLGSSDRLVDLFDKLVSYHKYLYEARDTLNNGLVAIWHNWESGMDNSPWWDTSLDRIASDHLEAIKLDRKDVKVVENYEEERPTDDEYRRYLWLLRTLQGHKFESCPPDFPFQLLDLTFNSLLIASTECILRLGPALGRDVSWFESKLEEGKSNFIDLMWNEQDGYFYPFDLVTKEQVPLIGAACFLPLFAGIPTKEQAETLVDRLKKYDGLYGIPSFDPSQEQYEPKKYWRGPIWVNMNYLICKGLERYGYNEASEKLKKSTIQMLERYGLREYYPVDTSSETGYGAKDFSWSASLALDLLNS